MESYGKRIGKNVRSLLDILFVLAKRIDYKRLTQYILGISRRTDLEGILREVSRCLKDILNYRLFAFAIEQGKQLEVWIDPSIYKDRLREVIENDFGESRLMEFHYLYEDHDHFHDQVTFGGRDLLAYGLRDERFFARVYILPGRKMMRYHGEIMSTILKTLGVSLKNHMNMKYLEHAAALDPLTNCYNKREFERRVVGYISNAKRYNEPLALIMFDLDHFKSVNDTHGHQAGDRVLCGIAKAIGTEIRKGDFLSRIGGEEFVLVLPHTKKSRAMELAERLRLVVQNLQPDSGEGKTIKVTASFGVASLREHSDKESLLEEVDMMLYMAKENGRNMVMPQLKLLKRDQGPIE